MLGFLYLESPNLPLNIYSSSQSSLARQGTKFCIKSLVTLKSIESINPQNKKLHESLSL